MKTTAMDLVKKEIFEWNPSQTDSTAVSDRSWVSRVFGGARVSLKSTHERHSAKFNQTLILDGTYAASQTVSGTLSDLLPAVRADLNKYLFIIDVFEFFKKIQVAASCDNIRFSKPGVDVGDVLRDPVLSAHIEVGYPDFSNPVVNGLPTWLHAAADLLRRLRGHGLQLIDGRAEVSGLAGHHLGNRGGRGGHRAHDLRALGGVQRSGDAPAVATGGSGRAPTPSSSHRRHTQRARTRRRPAAPRTGTVSSQPPSDQDFVWIDLRESRPFPGPDR